MGRRGKKLNDLVVDRYVNLELFNRQQRAGNNGCIEWTTCKFICNRYLVYKKCCCPKKHGGFIFTKGKR